MSDIVFNDGFEQITVLCDNLSVQGHDLLLDSPSRRKGPQPPNRRALVHDQGDGLTLNFSGDYPGGLTLHSVAVITPKDDGKPTPSLVINGGIQFLVDSFTSVPS
jgi:hypothetical protein